MVFKGRALLALLLFVCLGSAVAACGQTDANNSGGAKNEANELSAARSTSAQEDPTDLAEQTGYRTVQDELGHKLTIPMQPSKVFAPYMEDSLLSLGVVPVAQWSNGDRAQAYLQDRLEDVPKVDFAGGMPSSPEVVMSFDPDIIILHTAAYADNGEYEQYSKIAPTYVFENAAGDLENSITKLGELLGKSEEAEQAFENYRLKVEEAKTKLAPVIEGKKAAVINVNGKGMFLIGSNYIGGFVLAHELGIGQSKLVEGKNSADVSLEMIPELDADYVFIINYAGTGTNKIKELTESPIWKGIPAAQNGRVFEVNDEYWTGSGLVAYSKMIDDIAELLMP